MADSHGSRFSEAEIEFIGSDEFSQLEYSESKLDFIGELLSRATGGTTTSRDSSIGPLLAQSMPPLKPAEEKALFQRMNYLKFQAEAIRSTLSHGRPASRKLERIEALLDEAELVRRRIVEHNIRLVVSICRRYSRSDQQFQEFISEGLLILLGAASKFDYSRGFRFSTYATNSI